MNFSDEYQSFEKKKKKKGIVKYQLIKNYLLKLSLHNEVFKTS